MANVTYIAPVKAKSTTHKIRCAAYCRVSSSSEDQLHSYAAQVRFALRILLLILMNYRQLVLMYIT